MANGRFTAEGRHLRTLFGVGAVGLLTDGQLLERFATLDGEVAELAFAALVERHGPMVLRVARGVLRDEHDAHDAFQATFLLLARKARSLWVRDSLGPWLHAVACRIASQGRAAEIRRRRHERGAAGPEAFQVRDWDRDDLGRAIHEEIGRLPERYRSAVVLCHLEGLTQHEAARRLGWPVGTLQSRLAQGREKLRDRLGRRGLAPTIGAFPPIPAPDALVTATARAAATLHHGGGTIAGMIGPTVLAMIDVTSKGMLMTKLKLGAAGLILLGGLVASTTGLGVGPDAKATDEGAQVPKVEEKDAPPAPRAAAPQVEPILVPKAEKGKAAPPPSNGPGIPVLLDFHASWSGPCLQMRGEIDKLVRKGYPVQSMDIDTSKNEVDRFRVSAVPTYIVIDGSGREVARVQGAVPAARLAALYNGAEAQSESPVGPAAEPAPIAPPIPKPWATAARIKIHLSDKEWGFGSGTVIRSTPEESIILTYAHGFRIPDRPRLAPKDFQIPVTVDLFDGQLIGRKPAMVHCIQRDVAAEVIDFDANQDLGLLRIKPGRVLPASPVVPIGWKPTQGMKMIAVGCSHGHDATAWDTTILNPDVPSAKLYQALIERLDKAPHGRIILDLEPPSCIKCDQRPHEGRSGGGLFTSDGYLAGVNFAAASDENAGFYAAPKAIRSFLDRNQLSALYKRDADEPGLALEEPAPGPPSPKAATLEPAPPRPAPDQERRLGEVERKLDQIIEALKDIKGDFPPPRRR